MNDKFTENIKQRMADHTMAEPEGLWQSIEQRLDAAPQRHKAVAVPLWVRRAGVAAAAALLLGALAYVLTLGVEHDMDMRVEQIAIKEPIKPTASAVSEPVLAQNTPAEDAATRNDAYRAARVALNMAKAASDITREQHKASEQTAVRVAATDTAASVGSAPVSTADNTANKAQSSSQKTYAGSVANSNYSLIAENRNKKGSRLSAGIYTSGLPTNNSNNGLNSKYYLAQDMMNSSASASPTKRNQMPKLHHSMPLNVGVKVRYGITDRLFAETGVSYSYLRSHGDDAQMSYQQRLHYLGVPVDLGYTVWSNLRMKAYVKGGAEMQKLVSGRLTTTYNVAEPFAQTESVKERGAQWSTGAGVGFEVKALPKLSIYVEPSVKHYFDNGSQVCNTFKDNDTNFSLQVGLRLNP
ncbi:MAG: outer membrane beta-barrel protein [Muribaculaceae bacterium]